MCVSVCVYPFVHNLWIHVCGCVFASAQIAYEIWPLEKKFPVRVLLLELQSINFRYQIHPNRCSVWNDTGPWQPATDAGMKGKPEIKCPAHTHSHTHTQTYLPHFTGARCCSYHPHHLQLWGKSTRHAMTAFWWKFRELSSSPCLRKDVTPVLKNIFHCTVQSALWLAGKAFIGGFLKHYFPPYPRAADRWSESRADKRDKVREENSHICFFFCLLRLAGISTYLKRKKSFQALFCFMVLK